VAPDVRVTFTLKVAGRTLPAGALQVTEPAKQHRQQAAAAQHTMIQQVVPSFVAVNTVKQQSRCCHNAKCNSTVATTGDAAVLAITCPLLTAARLEHS
jgi:hypothetical protein